ncbi:MULTISPECIES: hypothetical protein [unclassified Shewanella]|uniref:hypothetical protein n=1 Tax=unclassified Shewanella TaxID=196818 RepID=UPI000C82B2A9|nr:MULTISPECIES: hypothetical protein [unclassified Shewanella]PMG30522.1 hypothetical protein BCU94_11010 [Shewanella sp. 10N.286.52.C2]PMG52436.1 hypothetical protein BCU91_00085 [Shewanella sp. 10N.286.52.B9]PMH86118.1 hypothetical protein BCU57_11515 [Shewanella sp. 10N.286.48.B5]
MVKILFVLLTSSFALLTSSTVQAEDVASPSSFTVGAGYQYGGVLGARYHFQHDSHVFSAALGLVGGALGYQYFVDESQSHSFGLSLGSEALTSEDGFAVINYEYYPSGFAQSGWQFGVSAGLRREDEGGSFGDHGDTKTDPAAMISVGYKF